MPQTGPAGPQPHFISYYDLFYHQQYRAASTARGETGTTAGAVSGARAGAVSGGGYRGRRPDRQCPGGQIPAGHPPCHLREQQAVMTGIMPQHSERIVHADPGCLGDHALGLLQDDPGAERHPKLPADLLALADARSCRMPMVATSAMAWATASPEPANRLRTPRRSSHRRIGTA